MNEDFFPATISRVADRTYRELLQVPRSRLSSLMDHNTAKNYREYPFYGDVGEVEDDRGSVTYTDIEKFKFRVIAEPFRNSFRVFRPDIATDELTYVPSRMRQLFQNMLLHRDNLAAQLLADGETGLAYDKTAYFANRAGEFDNLHAGSGSTIQQVTADIKAVRQGSFRFKTHRGNFIEAVPSVIICPPEMETTFLQIRTAFRHPSDSSNNTLRNVVGGFISDIIVDRHLVDTNNWYYAHVSSAAKPLIFQAGDVPDSIGRGSFKRNNIRVEIDESEAVKSDVYGVVCRTRHVVAYGLPQLITLVKNN